MNVLNDKKLRIVGPFVLFLGGTLFFRLDWYFELSAERLILSDSIGLAAGYICWNLARWVVLQLQQRYPGQSNTRRRLRWMALLLPVLVNFAWLIRQVGHLAFGHQIQPSQTLPEYTYAIGIQIFYHCIYFVIYEGGYLIRAWVETYRQNERLKKNKLQHKLDSLKTQINPHFLFNNLNSLSMLIHDNPRQAEEFVDEISRVYRYLLRANDQEMTTLGCELDFIRSYIQLLKTRYGSGIDFQIAVDSAYLNRKIPPLTLQLLVENAVKHNVIMAEKPLRVEVFSRDNTLVVQNNLQRKTTAVPSNKIGLANIATKYRLLSSREIVIHEEAGQFAVALPLLTGQFETNPMP